MSKAIKLPFLIGSKSAYAALQTKDAGKFYVLNDAEAGDSTIYLGDIPLAKNGYSGKVITGVEFDTDDHVFTFTFSDETTETVDLPTESVFANASYTAATHVLTFTLINGNTVNIDLSDLIPAAVDTIENNDENDDAIPTIGAVKGILVDEVDEDNESDDWKAVTVGALKAALELGTF